MSMKFCDKNLKKLVSWLKNKIYFIMDKLVTFIMKEQVFLILCISAFLIILFCAFAKCTKKNGAISLSYFYKFNVFFIIIVTFFNIVEIKKSNIQIMMYLIFSILYIELASFSSFLYYHYVSKCDFDSTNQKDMFTYSAVLLLLMLLAWILYKIFAMKFEYNKRVDEVELKIIYLKSILQSIVAFIAILGLSIPNLSDAEILIIMFIDSFAAFSYPVLDINKYIRQKEIEQYEIDKRYEPIKPNVKLKK